MANGVEDYILHGPPLGYEAKYSSVGKFIFDQLRMNPEFVGQIEAHTGHEYTYADILDRSIRFALWLRDMGIGPGDVVSYVTDNHTEVIIVVCATFFVGATMSCWEINSLMTRQLQFMKDEVVYFMDLTRPKLVVCVKESVTAVEAAAEELHVTPMILVHGHVPGYLSFDDTLKNHSKEKIANFQCTEMGENDMAQIQATSGTSGKPKLSFQNQKSVLIGIDSEVLVPKILTPGSVFLAHAPLSWVTGFIDVFRGLKGKHQRVLVPYDVDEKLIWSWIAKYRINYALMGPLSFLRLIRSFDGISDYDKSSLRVVYLSGATLHKRHYDKCQQLLPVGCKLLQRYGATETNGLVCMSTGTNSTGSSGLLIRGGSGKIIDPRTGKTISPYETGELCVKHPKMFQGYYKDPKSTNLAIDSDGWYHTGDLARFDRNGELYVIDKLKDILDVNGVKVSPSELEAILLQHSEVRNAGVVGRRVSSIVQHPVAFVVKNPGANLTDRELCDFVNLRVANENERLEGGVRFIDQMPLTTSGKIKRWELRKMLESETSCVPLSARSTNLQGISDNSVTHTPCC